MSLSLNPSRSGLFSLHSSGKLSLSASLSIDCCQEFQVILMFRQVHLLLLLFYQWVLVLVLQRLRAWFQVESLVVLFDQAKRLV